MDGCGRTFANDIILFSATALINNDQRATLKLIARFSVAPKHSISLQVLAFQVGPLTDFRSSAQLPNQGCELLIGSGTFQRKSPGRALLNVSGGPSPTKEGALQCRISLLKITESSATCGLLPW